MVAGQSEAVVELVREVFGTDVIGAYPHGSTATGQLRPHSDLDVLVVVRRHTTDEERRSLVARLLAISGGGPRPIELTIVVQSDVRPWRYPPICEFLFGEWLRPELESGWVPAPTPSPDLALLITMVLLGDRSLFGRSPSLNLDPVPAEDLRRAIADSIPGLLAALDSDTANVVLTLARCWTTVETGEIRSKDGAADWALARLPDAHRRVLRRARAIYLGEEDDRWDDLATEIHPHAMQVVEELRRSLPGQAETR
jgi:predicted nucleotidyltransferase